MFLIIFKTIFLSLAFMLISSTASAGCETEYDQKINNPTTELAVAGTGISTASGAAAVRLNRPTLASSSFIGAGGGASTSSLLSELRSELIAARNLLRDSAVGKGFYLEQLTLRISANLQKEVPQQTVATLVNNLNQNKKLCEGGVPLTISQINLVSTSILENTIRKKP